MPIHHLSKTWPRFIACSAIFAGATLGPPALAVFCPGLASLLPPAIAPFVTPAVNAIAGVFAGLVANDSGDLIKRLQRDGDVLANGDLTQATQKAIALIILKVAQDRQVVSADEAKQLKKLGKNVNNYKPSVGEDIYASDNVSIATEELIAIFSPQAAISQAIALPAWRKILRDFCQEAQVTLCDGLMEILARNLYFFFPKALVEVLKDDASKDGKAYAAMSLSLLGKIAANQQELSAQLNATATNLADTNIERFTQEIARIETGLTRALQVQQQQIHTWLQQLGDEIIDTVIEQRKILSSQIESLDEKIDRLSTLRERIHHVHLFRGVASLNENPPSWNSWRGRETETAKLLEWLRDDSVQMMGLVGLSGSGKSTLASRLYQGAAPFMNEFENRLWADVGMGATFSLLVRRVLVNFTGISEDEIDIPEPQLPHALVKCLCEKRYLLIIDNLETLLTDGQWNYTGYAEFFTQWLQSGTNSVVLVTTQMRPEIPESRPCWIDMGGLSATEGAEVLQDLGIKGSDTELQEFTELVQGHPLTLTLIAGMLNREFEHNPHIGKLQQLGLADLRQLLNDPRVKGLHRGAEVSLLVALEANFNRLPEKLQTLLMNVSIYRRPFNAEAAATVMAESETDAIAPDFIREVQQGLTQLRRSALLQVEEDENQECWYEFQPFIVAYLQQKTTDRDRLHKKAIGYYKSRLKALKLENSENAIQLKALKLEISRKTLQHFKQSSEIFYHLCQLEQYEEAYDTLQEYNNFINVSSYEKLVQKWKPTNQKSKKKFGEALALLGQSYGILGQYDTAINYLAQSLNLSREIGDRPGEVYSLTEIGKAYNAQGKYEIGMDYFNKTLTLSQEIDDRQGEATSFLNLGKAYESEGYYQQAIDYYKDSLKISQEIGDRQEEANSLTTIGNAYHSQKNHQEALNYYNHSLTISREIDNRRGEALSLGNIGIAYDSLGDYPKAIEHYQQSLFIKREIGDRINEGGSLCNLGTAYRSLGQYPEAIEYYQQALAILQPISYHEFEANSWLGLGYTYSALKQYEDAIQAYQKCLKVYQKCLNIRKDLGDRKGQAKSLLSLGNAYTALKQYQKAIASYKESLAIKRELGDASGQANTLFALSRLYQQCGRIREGVAAVQEAYQILQELDLPIDAYPYPQWVKSIAKFPRRSKLHLALCFIGGLVAFPLIVVAFPFALVWWVALMVWRLWRSRQAG